MKHGLMLNEIWQPSCYEYRASAPREIVHSGSDGDDPGTAAGVTGKPAKTRKGAAKGASTDTVGVEKVS